MPGENIPERLRSATLTRLGLEKSVLPPGVETRVDQLISALTSQDVAAKVAAVSALGRLGEQIPVEPLVRALYDESDLVRAAAALALGTLRERSALEPLLQALHDPSWRVRAAAALTVGKVGEREHTLIEELAALVNDEDESVCIAAVQSLGEMGELAPLEPLTFALYDQDWSVREAAVHALEKVGGKEALNLLEEALRDKDALVRAAAERALQRKAATEDSSTAHPNQQAQAEPVPLHPGPHRRRGQRRFSRRSFGMLVALVAAACIMIASLAIALKWFSRTPPPLAQSIGCAGFASSSTDLASQQDGSIGINDELVIDLYSLQAPDAGKSYYGWLLANSSDLKTAIPLGKLPFQGGKISYLYKDPAHRNLLLTASYFLITEEDTGGAPLTPTPDRSEWSYAAQISQVPNPSDTQHHYSLFDHLQHLLADDPAFDSIGLRGGTGFWLTRNTGAVGESAQSAQTFWKSHDARQVRNQIIAMLDYLDGTSYVNNDLPPGTPLQVPQAYAHFGLLFVDPQGLLAHVESSLKAITQSPSASRDQKALATRLITEVHKINAQLELVRQDARLLMQMTDAQLLQPSSLSLINDMAAHTASAFTGNAKLGLEGAVKVLSDIQSLANFDAEAYQH